MIEPGQRPDAVLFDCDGVLVDSEPAAARVVGTMLREAGWAVSDADVDALFTGATLFEVVAKARERIPGLPEDFRAQIHARMIPAMADVPPVDGIHALLDALEAAGIPFAIGSNGPHNKMQASLGATGLLARFEGRIVSAHDVPNAKPAPDVYLTGARLLGAPAECCVVVGDSKNDVLAAAAAGMGFIGVAELDRTDPAVFEAFGARYVSRLADAHVLLGL